MIYLAESNYQIFHNVCPRNCYNTCGILSYVRNGKLEKVEGDPAHGYTQGRLCAKGYAYPNYVYNPERLRYPLWQYPKGSGRWQRISWEKAYELIADQILELNRRYDSNLALAYNKFSGNIGLLNDAVNGMFDSLGTHTKAVGSPCASAGMDGVAYSFGHNLSSDPEMMVKADYIVIWGANPAWTAIHQFHFINEARRKGAKLIVIDPIYTTTAANADMYFQIQPGTDGLLALAIIKELSKQKKSKINVHDLPGWQQFKSYLDSKIDLSTVTQLTGLQLEAITELSKIYSSGRAISTWVGFGLQRHVNGGQNVRTISSLAGLTANPSIPGNGFYYFLPASSLFPRGLANLQPPTQQLKNKEKINHRLLNINTFAKDALSLGKPPVKFLWIASRNPLAQDPQPQYWQKLIDQLDMMVTVDLFMTATAKLSDLVLPVTSFFEAYDLNPGYWHYWVGINEQAIMPYYESKSDLDIAKELSQKLNQMQPNFSFFPDLTAEEWIEKECSKDILSLLRINSWQALKKAPRKLHLECLFDAKTAKPTHFSEFRIFSRDAKDDSLPALPKASFPFTSDQRYPFRLLSPQSLLHIHSQHQWLPQYMKNHMSKSIEINDKDALNRGLAEGNWVTVYNATGAFSSQLHLNPLLPRNILVAPLVLASGSVNNVIHHMPTDMGKLGASVNSSAFYDVFVDLKKQ
ncbi:molybdopterin-dependent oxidoreductase [Desulfosporosinus sp. SB140]|uniref:molybdopterin-dependent oxidoreductase n=1 Tax=Desulfosporosinus paludis TaxID=3115649 RepID=UPI00388F5CA5